VWHILHVLRFFKLWGAVPFLVLMATAALAAEVEVDIDDEFALLEESIADDEVESASKHRQSILWSPSTITVITREDIYASGATTFGDLLRRVPGLDVYMGKYDYPVVGIRAQTDFRNNLVLVLIDGREAATELTGFTLYNAMPIDLEEIERVEIVRGPGSTLFGANAYAGVINITTVADRPKTGGDVSFSEGEAGRHHVFARARGSFAAGDGLLSFSGGGGVDGKRAQSNLEEEQYDVYRAHAYLRYQKGKDLDLSLHYGAVGGSGLIFVHMGDLRPTVSREHSVTAKAEIGLSENTRLRTQFYYISNETVLVFRSGLWAYDLWIADPPEVSWHTQALDYQFQVNSQLLGNLLLIGGGYIHYTFLTHDNVVLKDDDELRGAGFVQAQYSPLETLQITAGARLDLNTDTKLAVSPRAVAVFRPWPEQAFRASYGLAFRKPSFYESRVHLEVSEFNPAMPEIVQKMAEGLGNEDLDNEQVHSFEAGWLGRFLDERLRVSIDLYYNIYLNTTVFVVDIPLRMGAPDILNSTLQFENSPEEIHAMGGEAEVAWKFDDAWSAWCNLGLRQVESADTGEELETEPTLRVNLGGRYLPAAGWLVDVALHYVSSYSIPLVNPANTLDPPDLMPLGDRFLLFGRIGYRVKVLGDLMVEGGLTIRAPLGEPFREWAGIAQPPELIFDTNSDFGGERVARLVALYLRGSF